MRSAPTTKATPTLPALDTDCYLLSADKTSTGPLQALVLDHLLMNDGPAYWVDAVGHARTDTLARIAPSTRLLDRIQVARGFTAYQHAALLDRVTELVTPETALVVAPAVDTMYRDEDIQGVDATELLQAAVSTLTSRCRETETPIVLTCQQQDALSAPIARHADETIQCETTQFGPRFVGDQFETLVYPLEDGTVQTTLAFWKHVLSQRVAVASTCQPEVLHGSN